MSQPRRQINLPRLHKATLEHFSLYSRKEILSADFSEGVFCLAGANGLGKSTFLIAVNFALTGIVAEPERPFLSVEEFYKENMEFASAFFSGRITEKDRDQAQISIEVKAGNLTFKLTRGMFEKSALRKLEIAEDDGTSVNIPKGSSPGDLDRIYSERITQQIGLESFEQFVFLQQYVLTFDERRHLLFWDPRVLERSLYIAFGDATTQASKADILRRKAEKADSYARNFSWQASAVRDKIKDLEDILKSKEKGKDSQDLEDIHKRLDKRVAETQDKLRRAQNELLDISLELADLSSRQVALKTQYSEEFGKRLKSGFHLQAHPLIAASLREQKCNLCETPGKGIKATILSRISTGKCPLCESELKETGKSSNLDVLKRLDKELAQVSETLANASTKRVRLQADIAALQKDLASATQELEQFLQENQKQLNLLQSKSGAKDSQLLEEYRRRLAEFNKKKDESYQERDEARAELKQLQKQLQARYGLLEEEFVPLFKKLAHDFLGLDLDIRLESSANTLGLIVEVKGASRRQHHQLSESQKYFIDIALRMALIQFVSSQKNSACLFIDTPEGSLDIAYETQAGQMFGRFVKSGFSILMTANINSSQLLIALAKECGSRRMHLCRMTTWTELSDVQQAQHKLFQKAYGTIEKTLAKRKRT